MKIRKTGYLLIAIVAVLFASAANTDITQVDNDALKQLQIDGAATIDDSRIDE